MEEPLCDELDEQNRQEGLWMAYAEIYADAELWASVADLPRVESEE